ncbi:toprim domain-containing protein, partial [Chitinimonas sp. PSY-7]|uniref:toprim domain-containing protein n=1 Tax=Chitinimonas sp. PSY-7 TaxID=3459088 RepID=UPI0040402EC7
WVMKRRNISFRHAAEWLRTGLGDRSLEPVLTPSSLAASPVAESPMVDAAERQTLLGRVLAYYHDTLKQSPEALAYLDKRGLNHPELIGTFQLGYANRTLGYRLPAKTLKAGIAVRQSLQTVGLLRESGHEHFNGSLVVPVIDLDGQIHEVYGRKIRTDLRPGTADHLYLPGTHAGVWNEAGLAAAGGEVILCEALIDAMTFWVNGLRNVTASYGVNGFTDDHLAAFERHGVKRVLIAYDHDEAGDKAARALAERLQALGIDCWRIRFPHGLDANAYALAMKPAPKALSLAVRKAEWMGLEDAPSEGKQALAAMASRVIARPEAAPPLPLAAEVSVVTAELVPTPLPVAELPASPVPPAPHCDLSAEVSEREVVMQLGGRRWRVR